MTQTLVLKLVTVLICGIILVSYPSVHIGEKSTLLRFNIDTCFRNTQCTDVRRAQNILHPSLCLSEGLLGNHYCVKWDIKALYFTTFCTVDITVLRGILTSHVELKNKNHPFLWTLFMKDYNTVTCNKLL